MLTLGNGTASTEENGWRLGDSLRVTLSRVRTWTYLIGHTGNKVFWEIVFLDEYK